MSKHFRDIFITIVSLLGLVFVYRARLQKEGPLLRVLVFHDVHDADWFKESVTYIQKHYHVITPEDFLQKNFETNRTSVLVTFDDGYASWVDVCLPILAEQKIRALFFINSGLIDTFDDARAQEQYVRERLLLSPRDTLSWEGVRRLKNAGHMIGGHTVSHARLGKLSEVEQRSEIVRDKERIEMMLGGHLVTFAYPFGQHDDYSKVTEGILAESGYTHAFTTEGMFASFSNSYTISRLCIEDNATISDITYWIEGGYDLYRKVKSLCVR